MPADAFRLLRAMGEHADAFEGGSTQAQSAVTAIFVAAVKASDKARLTTICDAIGTESFDALAGEIGQKDVKAIVDRLDGPAKPARSQAAALAALRKIARGIVDPPPIDLADLDLAGLRQAHANLDDGFEAWLTKQGTKTKSALQAMEPYFPKVATVTPARARSRLTELARGAEPIGAPPPTPPRTSPIRAKTSARSYDGPTPSSRLVDLDLEGLRRAKSELGEHFKAWIEAQKPADLKATLVRVDPNRPNVKKLNSVEYPFLLDQFASGASVYGKDDDVPPIGAEKFSMQKV